MTKLKLVVAGIAALCVTGCGSEIEEPIEQIVVAEPGEEAGFPGAGEQFDPEPANQLAE